MTEIQPAHFTDGACHTAVGDRQVTTSLVCGEGVAIGANGGGDLAVTQRGAGANMSVDVASGNAFIEGTEVGWQGMYHVSNDGTVNLTVAAADPTDDRIDLVVARVRDASYSGTDRDWLLAVVTGTASPAPAPPALPDNSLLLATLSVGAGATSVVNADITDERVPYTLCQGVGGLLDTLVFSSNDTFAKADYPTMAYLDVEVQAGGGGGGGAAAAAESVGNGGGSGAYCRAVIPIASLGASETITVGSAGTGAGGASDGGNGGNSSFGAHVVCGGGNGGSHTTGPGDYGGGTGLGGTVTTAPVGAIEIDGVESEGIWWNGAIGRAGAGASSHLGNGGAGTTASNAVGLSLPGNAGTGYGAGGGGAMNSGGGNNTGGNGSPGVVIVRVYG